MKAHWYAVYVRPKHEKKALALLEQKGIEAYLPLRKEIRQWADRKKEVHEPLIRGYLFVQIDIRKYYDVLVVPGVISFVIFDQQPAVIPDYQIEDLKIFLSQVNAPVEVSNQKLRKGQLVRITDGPFAGAIAEINQLRGKTRLLVRMQALGCVVHTVVETVQMEPVSKKELQEAETA